jgi:Na+/H+ antiporter NhaA
LSVWQVGADYLSHCGSRGIAYLETFLEHLPITDERKAMKMIAICNEHSLSTVANGIAKQMTIRCLKSNQLNAAIGWCLQTKVCLTD